MRERLSILGGGGRWINLFAAIKIGGFTDPVPIYEAIRAGEIVVNEKLCSKENPEAQDAWIQIEAESFIRWLERRTQVDVGAYRDRLEAIRRCLSGLEIKVGRIQAATSVRADRLERHIASLRSEIELIKQLLIDNLRSERQGRSLRVKRRPGV